MTRLNVAVPTELHDDLRRLCIDQRTQLKDLVPRLLAEAVAAEKRRQESGN